MRSCQMRKASVFILRRMICKTFSLTLMLALLAGVTFNSAASGQEGRMTARPRARDVGLRIGVLPVGPLNAITDVAGVRVGHTTIIRGEHIRTGVTAILPHAGNLFREKVPGAVFVGNGFGKLMGSTQVRELGEIETPILLTSTLSVPRVADFLLDYMLALPGNEEVRSVNPLVAETNDGFLNDIRGRHITRDDVLAAIRNASAGAVPEGAVGAGTGTIAFGFKGGIGTSSRRLPASLGGYTVGVLVQTNFGGVLQIGGAPVGRELGRFYLREAIVRSSVVPHEEDRANASGAAIAASEGRPPEATSEGSVRNAAEENRTGADAQAASNTDAADGSIIIVIATDAPVDARNLERLAARAIAGLARTGAAMTNGSGDYAIAFSTAEEVRLRPLPASGAATRDTRLLSNDAMSPLFLAAIEATEEAIINSLFRATTMTGQGRTIEALPLERTIEILRRYGALPAAPAR